MNNAPKVVFSRTMEKATWNNTKLVKGDLAAEVRRMKGEPGQPMVIFGSGTIISQLAQEGLIDEYQFVVNPVVLGKGKPMFDGIKDKLALKLIKSRTFGNGSVFCATSRWREERAECWTMRGGASVGVKGPKNH